MINSEVHEEDMRWGRKRVRSESRREAQHIGKKNSAGGRSEGRSLRCRLGDHSVSQATPPMPRQGMAQCEVGAQQMLTSTALPWSSEVRVTGRKVSEASPHRDRADRAFAGFLESTRKTLQPTLDQMLLPLYWKTSHT